MSFKPLDLADMRQWKVAAHRPKKRKKNKVDQDSSGEIEMSNSFEALADNNSEDSLAEDPDKMEGVENPDNRERKPRIPPLVIYTHIKDHVKTLQEMQKELSEKLTINCKSDRMIIYTKNESDYKIMRDKIAAAKVSFHTYSLESEKPVVSILKGLPANITTLEIKEDIKQDSNLKVLEIKQFIKKTNIAGTVKDVPLPIFCVKFEKGTKIADVKKIRVVCWCKVHWEKNVPSNLVTQCYKCQGYGHIAKNCFRKECCGICAGAHNSLNCTSQNIEKCINCGENHRASDSRCELYARAVSRKQLSNRVKIGHSNTSTHINNNNNDGPSSSNKTGLSFAQAARVKQSGDRPINNHNGQFQQRQQHQGDNDVSMGALLVELKSFFRDFNFQKIVTVVKNMVIKIRRCDDAVSKFACIVESLIEFFD